MICECQPIIHIRLSPLLKTWIQQIQAIPWINHCTNNWRFGNLCFAPFRMLMQKIRIFQSPFIIIFPEINSIAKPSIVVPALTNFILSWYNLTPNQFIAAMEYKYNVGPLGINHLYSAVSFPAIVIIPDSSRNFLAVSFDERTLSL